MQRGNTKNSTDQTTAKNASFHTWPRNETNQINLPWDFKGMVRIAYQGMVPKPIGSGGSDGSLPCKINSRGASQEIETVYAAARCMSAILANQHAVASSSTKQNTLWNLESRLSNAMLQGLQKNEICFAQPLILLVAFSLMLRWLRPDVLWTLPISLLMTGLAKLVTCLNTEISKYLESGPNKLYGLTCTAS